jgi:predicted nucleic acid-binding protein
MPTVLCDASVALKWFLSDEPEAVAATALVEAAADGVLDLRIAELAVWEVANVAARRLGREAAEIHAMRDQIEGVCGTPVHAAPAAMRAAVDLSVEHRLSYYDALHWSVARDQRMLLTTTDRELLLAGAGEMPSTILGGLA